jgi:hypothetical protein
MKMSGKKVREILPQDFGACGVGLIVTLGGAFLHRNPVIVLCGLVLIAIPAVIVIVRRVAGG